MSAAISMDRHPFLRLRSRAAVMPSMGYDGSDFSNCGNFTRVGFLVIVNFEGLIQTYGWVNGRTDGALTSFPIPSGFEPSVKVVVPLTGSSYNCSFAFGTDGNVEVYGYGLGYIHGFAVYPTANPL